MIIKKASDIRSSEITPKEIFLRRREFIQAGTAALIAAGCGSADGLLMAQGGGLAKLPNVKKNPQYSTTETANTYDQITSHNNFYEFEPGAGPGPRDTARRSRFKARPWKLAIDGEVAKPGNYDIDEFLKPYALEERIYRMRCVEAWSLVVPWVGFQLSEVIKRVEPTSKAKFIEFTTLVDPSMFPGQRERSINWPYREGLRLDEANHPLTILAVGLYGEVLPPQNGAPLRLVVPWKYGFKGIKSIVRMRFQEQQPLNSWQQLQPSEYGFYANVNPQVDHPRWSQSREARLPSFLKNTATRPFNGYQDQVQGLYAGMDLRKNY